MTNRYFDNFMRDLIDGASTLGQKLNQQQLEQKLSPETGSQHPLFQLLSMPYPTLTTKFTAAALHLKQAIVAKTWGSHETVQDFTLYSGAMGTAFLLFKSFKVSANMKDLDIASQIIKACDFASAHSRDITFICGRAGVCALGAVVAKNQENQKMINYYVTQFKKIDVNSDHPDEILYGRAGYLWACLFLTNNFGHEIIPSSHTVKHMILNTLIINGRKLSDRSKYPLMYKWYGTRYWGAAHGLSGIMYVLMHFTLPPDVLLDIKSTLKYMINNRLPSGNYPSCEEAKSNDDLVHWCHGAPGMALTFIKAAEVFEDEEFVKAAIDAAEVVWKRGLLKRVGLCHGISGNAYVFLSLFQLTGNVEFLYKAKAFSCFLLDRAEKLILEGEMHGGDSPYSLFEGVGGMSYLFLDLIDPANARFPGHEL